MRLMTLAALAALLAAIVSVHAPARPAATALSVDPTYFVVAENGPPQHGDSYILPLTDPAQLREARDILHGLNGMKTIVVAGIALGSDGINRDALAAGEPLWSWHVISCGGFAETTAEVLDGWPGQVEQNPCTHIACPPDGDGTGTIGFWAYTVTQELGPGPGISPPTAPSGLSVSVLGGGQARATWSDRSNNEEGFELQRQQKVGSLWTNTTLISLGANTTSYTDTPGVGTFQYRVRSWNIAGSSAWTAWKSIKTR